jgi:transposase
VKGGSGRDRNDDLGGARPPRPLDLGGGANAARRRAAAGASGQRRRGGRAWLRSLPQPLRAGYEAGPTGFVLYRAARAAGIASEVVAPTKTPRAPGEPVKSDRKDAELGLVPALSQSGESSVQGGITKTGSRYARRILVEAAWHDGRPPRIGVTLRRRQARQPAHVLQIAWRCKHRLHRLRRALGERRKPGNVTTVALARSLACFLWAAAVSA